MTKLNPMNYPIHDPDDVMSLEERAQCMTGVHPAAMDEMGFRTRKELYIAHLRAAIRDATNAS